MREEALFLELYEISFGVQVQPGWHVSPSLQLPFLYPPNHCPHPASPCSNCKPEKCITFCFLTCAVIYAAPTACSPPPLTLLLLFAPPSPPPVPNLRIWSTLRQAAPSLTQGRVFRRLRALCSEHPTNVTTALVSETRRGQSTREKMREPEDTLDESKIFTNQQGGLRGRSLSCGAREVRSPCAWQH